MYKTLLFMNRFCVENILIQDSEMLDNYRSVEGRFFLQMLFTHMYTNNFIIASEYFNYYVHLMEERNFRGYYLVDDELQQMSNYDDDHDSYLHPSDLFCVDIPEMWLKLFHSSHVLGMTQINFVFLTSPIDSDLVSTYKINLEIDPASENGLRSAMKWSIVFGGHSKPP